MGEKDEINKTLLMIMIGISTRYNYLAYREMELLAQTITFTQPCWLYHDTFRSNQIREGDITRDEALHLVEKEKCTKIS